MFISASLKKFLLILLLVSPVSAGYNYSDTYLFSFYVPARYKKQQVKNDYGPFLQFSHPDARLFIHFWARPRPGNADLAFLLKAYEDDFLKNFVSKIKQRQNSSHVEDSATRHSIFQVEILERDYSAEIYTTHKNDRFYVLSFFYPAGKKDDVLKDIELVIYSLTYGR